MLLDREMRDIISKCDHLLTTEQIFCIRQSMLNYAAAAVMDSSVREELFAESRNQE